MSATAVFLRRAEWPEGKCPFRSLSFVHSMLSTTCAARLLRSMANYSCSPQFITTSSSSSLQQPSHFAQMLFQSIIIECIAASAFCGLSFTRPRYDMHCRLTVQLRQETLLAQTDRATRCQSESRQL